MKDYLTFSIQRYLLNKHLHIKSYICAPCMHPVPVEARRRRSDALEQMPWNRCPGTSYWWFWVAMLMLGIELEFSTRSASTLEHWIIYPPPWNILKDILSHHGHLESQCSVLCYMRKCSYGTIFVFLQHCTKQCAWQNLVKYSTTI